MAICLLCRQEEVLIEAHIIPKWAFKYLYPNKEDFDKRALILVRKNKPNLKRRIGSYDSNILCAKCDNFLGKYDEYGKKVILDFPLESRSKEAYVIKNIDFSKFKIFLLSVLWRASISNLPEYKEFIIGPYSDRIREIIFDLKTGVINEGFNEYSFIIGRYEEGKLPSNIVNKNIQTPYTLKINGINAAVLYLPKGLKVFIKIDKRNFTGAIKKLTNYKQEGLIVAKLGNYVDSTEFQALMNVYKSKRI